MALFAFAAPLTRQRLGGMALAVACIGMSACGNDSQPGADSQVAARVNKGDISVHQVQSVLKRQPRLLAEQPATAAGRVLDSLVEQELAAQAAQAQNLDRDPGVVQALDVARREVLARAYQERLVALVSGPSSDEIDRYYESRPELFSQRRLYTLKEFIVEADAGQMLRLQELAKQARTADELTALLANNNLRNRARQFVQAAEDMPLAVLGPMAKLSLGQSLVLPQKEGARVFTITQVLAAPVERRLAVDQIAAFIANERKRVVVAEGMKTLRDSAQITYQGAFAKPAASAPVAAVASNNP